MINEEVHESAVTPQAFQSLTVMMCVRTIGNASSQYFEYGSVAGST